MSLCNAKSMIGMPVGASDGEELIAWVKELILDDSDLRVIAVLAETPEHECKLLPLGRTQWGFMLLPSAVANAHKCGFPLACFEHRAGKLRGTHVRATDDHELGTVSDFYFSDADGVIVGLKLKAGLLADAYSGRKVVPAAATHHAADGVLVLDSDGEIVLETQVGGIEGALQTVTSTLWKSRK